MKKFLNLISVFILTLFISACGLIQTEKGEPVKNTVESENKKENNKKNNENQEDSCTPLLYKVTDNNGGVLYLFGSIHVGDKRMKQMPDYVLNAYEESTFLAVECDIIAFEKDFSAQMEYTQMLLCSEGKTIEDYLGNELFDKVKTYLEEKDAYRKMYKSYSPAMWQSLIENIIVEESGLDTSRGADRFFLKMAKKEGKEIREVESVAFQYNMMLNFSDELYRYMIESSIDQAEESINATKELYEVWLRGNEKELGENIEDDVTNATEEELRLYEEYEKAMLTDRNLGMLDKAEQYLAEGITGFYVVGAAHVVGEGALAELLEEAGYEVSVVNQ